MILTLIRLFTLVYLLVIAGVVVSAGSGWFPQIFAWVQKGATDKWMHFLLIGVLTLLVNLSIRCKVIRVGNVSIQLGTLAILICTTMEEFSQLFIARRSFDWYDMMCNGSGALTFGILAWVIAGILGLRQRGSDDERDQSIDSNSN